MIPAQRLTLLHGGAAHVCRWLASSLPRRQPWRACRQVSAAAATSPQTHALQPARQPQACRGVPGAGISPPTAAHSGRAAGGSRWQRCHSALAAAAATEQAPAASGALGEQHSHAKPG